MAPRRANKKRDANNKAKGVVLDEFDNHESGSDLQNSDQSAKKRKSDGDEDEFGQSDSLKEYHPILRMNLMILRALKMINYPEA
jgi:hypothetical protein